MNDATFYLLRYSCPLFEADVDKRALELVGTSVPFSIRGRQFLLTAGHIVERYGTENLLYPTDRENRVGVCGDFVGTALASVPGPSGFDDTDLAIVELPPGRLSSSYTAVPSYMVATNVTLKHVDTISLIGYPITKNKYRPRSLRNIVKSVALEIPHAKAKYDALGLNPVMHFCARFNQKEMEAPDGRGFRPMAPNGLSGGPAWHVTETSRQTGTDEGACLLGIISEHNAEHNVIWGPRVSYAFHTLAGTIPELADGFNILKRHRTFDAEEIHYFGRATRNA